MMVQLFPLSTSTLGLKQRTRPCLREPDGSHSPCSHRRPSVHSQRQNLSQVSKSRSWLGLRQENQRQAEGSPGREHSRT